LTNIIRHEFGQRGAAGLDFKAHPHMLRHACGFNAGQDTRVLRMRVL
jgi:site-specific recombinase XerD